MRSCAEVVPPKRLNGVSPPMQGESEAMQAGVQVTHNSEKLVVDALMAKKPTDVLQLSSSLDQCKGRAAWSDASHTEWVIHCARSCSESPAGHVIPHRLYVQATQGEMRLATVMVTEV